MGSRCRRTMIVSALLSGVLMAAGALGPRPVEAGGMTVSIQNYMFAPATLSVPVGTTVTWTNNDTVVHTSTSDVSVWDSGPITPGQSYSYTFSRAGTFTYHCMIHPYMHGTIVVGGAPPSIAPSIRVTPSSVMAGQTAVILGAGFTPANWAFAFWRRPDGTTNGTWVPTTSNGTFLQVLAFDPRHGSGTELVTAFDWGTRQWVPFAPVTVTLGTALGVMRLVASPNPVTNGGTAVITGQGFPPDTPVLVQWRRPDGTIGAATVVANRIGAFSFSFTADPRRACGPRIFVAVDRASGMTSPPMTLGVLC
jgi:plastocyanin